MRIFRSRTAELHETRRALLIVVAGFAERIERGEREVATLRAETAAMRAELAALPEKLEGKLARDAMALIRESGQHAGRLQAQLEALRQPEALVELAGEMAARDLLQHLNSGSSHGED